MPSRRTVLTFVAAAAAAAFVAPPALALGHLVDVQVVDRSRGGGVLETHRHRGASYVVGRPADRYAVRMTNRTGARVMVVLSVDGINAVSGETASTSQTGYVLDAWQTADITGWRKSRSETAAFYFTSLPDSYAARTDRPDHVGVIGAAVFRERVTAPPPAVAPEPAREWSERNDEQPRRRAQAPSGSAAADATARESSAASPPPPAAPSSLAESRAVDRDAFAKADKLGTGHGERVWSPITMTSFERATSRPAELMQIRYDSYANLVAAGVIVRPRAQPFPNPFPGFAPDPR